MTCPECGENNNRVINTDNDEAAKSIIRVRKCMSCGFAWVTEEKKKAVFMKQKAVAQASF